jgi:hypothetical protein
MTETMTWIAPQYLRILVDRAASHPEPPDDPALVNEALQYAERALEGQVPGPEAKPEPSLPPGEYARVEIMGHDSETGWVSDGTRAGVSVLVIRGHDGRVRREVPGHALFSYWPLPTPLKRPDPQAAITAGALFCRCSSLASDPEDIDVRPDCPVHGLTQDEADAWRELREDDDGSGPF